MKRFLFIVIVIFLCLPLQVSAEELPMAFGVTLGGPIKDVLDEYVKLNIKPSHHGTSGLLTSYVFPYPLIKYPNVKKVVYYSHNKKLVGVLVHFDPEIYNELNLDLKVKYGPPNDETKFSADWQIYDLGIHLNLNINFTPNELTLKYDYLPWWKERMYEMMS